MRLGSLFTGIGGFDLAFERAGGTVAYQVEIDRFARRVLAARWPDVERHADIRELTNADIDRLPPVDVVAGGWPCQDLSLAGRRAGLAGDRSGLFHEFVRVIARQRPTWILAENVPGLLSSGERRDMGTVLGTLADLGYHLAYRVLDAQYYSLAQRRSRVWIAGHSGDRTAAATVLFESQSGVWDTAPRRCEGQTVAGALRAGLAGGHGAGAEDAAANRIVVGTIIGGDVTHTLRGESFDASEDGRGRGVPIIVIDPTQVTSPSYSTDPRPGDPVHTLHRGLAPLALSLDGAWARKLTPKECERLQGYPDGHTCLCSAAGDTMTCGCPDGPRYRAIGNAVPVPVVEWIVRRMMAVDAGTGSG